MGAIYDDREVMSELTYDEENLKVLWLEEECETELAPPEDVAAAREAWVAEGHAPDDLAYVEVRWTFPARFEVCGDCEGKGRTLNENLRGAFTSEEFNECFDDDESREEYRRGGAGIYGVDCKSCGGKRVLLQVDAEALAPREGASPTPDQRAYERFCAARADARRWEYESRREREMEARMLGEWDG